MTADAPPAFVDTNILVYALERSDSPKKRTAARLMSGLIATDRLRVSTQVLQELFVTLTRKVARPCSATEALSVIDDLAAWPLFAIDHAAIRSAGELTEQSSISFRDALILIAASRSGAAVVYTEDLNHGQKILDLEIVNPFLVGEKG